jgi:hypothetical protein
MKIILSRKGFDDQYGGKPSIILPDNTMISFPIPAPEDEFGYLATDIKYGEKDLSFYLDQLDIGNKFLGQKFHFDPWIQHNHGLGVFGQSSAALSHLKNNNISKGDVFLFFGSFCKTSMKNERLTYDNMHSFHAIWGYLKIDSIADLNSVGSVDQQFRDHVHYKNRNHPKYKSGNSLYISMDFGTFGFRDCLMLTKLGYKKSYWRLPSVFADKSITYHDNVEKKVVGNFVEFNSVAKGQEFVIDNSDNALDEWLSTIMSCRKNQPDI